MDQNINESKSYIWNSFFETIISVSGMQIFYIRPHVSVDIIRVYFNFLILQQKVPKLTKTSEKINHFTIQFHSKNLTHLMNRKLTLHWKQYALAIWPKLSHFTNFPANKCYGFYKFYVYFCIYPLENFCSRHIVRFYLVGVWGGVGEMLNNFLKATRRLSLVKYFTISHFNWNFWKLNYFSAFR